jgi:hypothetical protein
MKLTIIRSDNAVYKDGVAYSDLDLSVVPANVHALQWYESEGEVEFNGSPKPQNEIIFELPTWAITSMTKWDEAKAAEEEQIARLQEQINSLNN